MDWIWFWISKQIAELAVAFGFLILIGVFAVLTMLPGAIRRLLCKHKTYRENRACHGICCACGTDLGFIGTLRKDASKKEV